MFIITFGDFVGGMGAIVLIAAILLFIIFLCKGGFNLNYAMGISLVAISFIATLCMLGRIIQKIKKKEKSGIIFLIFVIIVGIFGYIVPFQTVFMCMKFNGIFSVLIYEMILSIFLSPILYDIDKNKILSICSYFFKILIPMFFMAFAISVFVVMFLYAGGENEKGLFKKIVDSGMTYNSIFFDKERKNKTIDDLVTEMFLGMDQLKDNKEIDERVHNACKNDLNLQDQPCHKELVEQGNISDKNYFRALLSSFKETIYKQIGKKSGMYITESKELDDGTFVVRIVDQKQRDIYYYLYDWDNKIVTLKNYEYWKAYSNCSNGICSYVNY